MVNDTNLIGSTSTTEVGPSRRAPKIKLGDALKAIGQTLQGFELELTRDKTPTDPANFEDR